MKTRRTGKTKTPVVDRDHALHLLRAMIRIRRLEEKGAELYNAMKIRGFLHIYDSEKSQFQNAPFWPISALGSNFNPRNTPCIPAVEIFARLDLGQTETF